MALISTIIAVVVSLSLILALPSLLSFINVYGSQATPPIVSTRGLLFTSIDYQTTNNILGLEVGECTDEIVVYVHGWLEDEESAMGKFNILKKSLSEGNGYAMPVVGFSWTSNVYWHYAKYLATINGERLAQFIVDFKTACENTQIRVLGHSLGA
jgi:esterase/lipase superfamily enzyme